MNTPVVSDSYQYPPPPHTHTSEVQGWGNNIPVGVTVKAKVSELEDEVRDVFPMHTRKYLTGAVESVSVEGRLLVS